MAEPASGGDDRRVCPKCMRVIRIAPSSMALLAAAERRGRVTRVRCWYCARADMDRPGLEFGLAPGSLEEILARHGGNK